MCVGHLVPSLIMLRSLALTPLWVLHFVQDDKGISPQDDINEVSEANVV